MSARLLRSAAFHTRRLLLEARPERPAALPPGRAVVSFTFDDFPASALEAGGAMLERQGVAGTFYWSGGLPQEGSTPAALAEAAAQRGHEVACHTHAHLDCAITPPAALAQDLDRNAAALSALRPGWPAHFAFPYGRAGLESRALVARRFATGRGVHHGINRGTVDLALLRANPLYGRESHYRRAMALIDDTRREGGWLIFFTHDVSDAPGPYGAMAVAMEHILRAALAAGCEVLPVGAAARSFGFSAKQPA